MRLCILKFREQRLGSPKIGRLESLGEFCMRHGKPVTGLSMALLLLVEAREAGRGAEFPSFALLMVGDLDRPLEVSFRLRAPAVGQCKLSLEAVQLSFMTTIMALSRDGQRLVQRRIGVGRAAGVD